MASSARTGYLLNRRKRQHGPGDKQGGLLGAIVGHGLGDDLTQHHQQGGNQQKGETDSDRVGQREGDVLVEVALQQPFDSARHDCLAQRAHEQAGDGNPQLGSGKKQPYIGKQRQDGAGTRFAFPDQLLQARATHGQERVFRRHKKRVERHKAQNEQCFEQSRHERSP